MSFQSTVSSIQGFGVVGELFTDSPIRSQSYILNTITITNNVIGRACTLVPTVQGQARAGNVDAAGVFAGILANPKTQPLNGTSTGGSLAPTLLLPNNSQVDIVSMGTIIVALPSSAGPGDLVVYENATGILSTISPGAALPVNYSFAYATVDYFVVSAAGLAVITLTPTLTIPELA